VTVFLDTNVLAYQFDADRPDKRQRAMEIFRDIAPSAVISTQVLLELHSVLTRKLGFSKSAAREILEVLDMRVIGADVPLVLDAARTADEQQLSMWDAMILEAAVRGSCHELWTEDLSTGSTLRGVKIVNPFL
jgi:predicted nucleic acid-binding protein